MASVEIGHRITRLQSFDDAFVPGSGPPFPPPGQEKMMAAVTLGHNITRQEDFEGAPPGSFQSIGSGPGAGEDTGLHYQGTQAVQRRISATGSEHGFTYTHDATLDLTGAGNSTWLSKTYTVLAGSLNQQMVRAGNTVSDYFMFLVGEDGDVAADHQDFLAPPKGGYIIQPIDPNISAWIWDEVGAPDITIVDVFGCAWIVSATTGAGDSSAMDSLDFMDDGLFLWGGDGGDADGVFLDFLDADEAEGLTGAERTGLWTSQQGILFVYGMNVIGRQDGGTVTATEFTDENQTVVFPGGYVDAGFNGFEFDLGNASTVIDWTGITMIGRGRSAVKVYFDTELDVDAVNDELDIVGHLFKSGDQVVYSAEGNSPAEDIGPDETNGVAEGITSGGFGTGAYWWMFVVNADAIAFSDHGTAGEGMGVAVLGSLLEDLTASTAGNGEAHSITRTPDIRPDLFMTGTSGTATLTRCILNSLRDITLTSAATLSFCSVINTHRLVLGDGTIGDCSFTEPTTFLGEAFIEAADAAELADVSDCLFTAGSAGGHAFAAQASSGDVTVAMSGNALVGYGPGSADDAGVHDNEFDTGTDISSGNDTITLGNDLFATGDPIFYSNEGGSQDIGLADGALYWLRRTAANTYQVHPSATAASTDANAINLTAGGAETHILYSASAAFHNETGNEITLQISGGGSIPSVRNSNGSSTIIEAAVTVTFDGMRDDSEVWVFPTGVKGEGNEIAMIENATAGSVDNRSFAWSAAASTVVDYIIHSWDANGPDFQYIRVVGFVVPGADTTIDIAQQLDRNSV